MKHITALLLLFSCIQCLSQDLITDNETYRALYRDTLISGTYSVQSLLGDKWVGRKIEPMLNYNNSKYTQYIAIKDKPILLFKNPNPNPSSKSDVAGKLWTSSFVELLTIEYRTRYRDYSKKWSVSHEVWKKVKINGEIFYTDYKLHDRIISKESFKSKNQTLLIIAQNDGYDAEYDLGYPEFFHFVAVDNDKGIIYDSGTIEDYSCNCEFGLDYDVTPIVINDDGQAYIQLSGTIWDKKTRTFRGSNISFFWNGKELIADN